MSGFFIIGKAITELLLGIDTGENDDSSFSLEQLEKGDDA